MFSPKHLKQFTNRNLRLTFHFIKSPDELDTFKKTSFN